MTLSWRNANLLAGAALAALSLYILYTASGWTLIDSDGPGPGFFPMGYGLLMLGLSIALTVQSVSGSIESEQRAPVDRAGLKAAATTWAAIIASIPLMTLLGFTVGFGLAAMFIIRVVFQRSWGASLITAAAISGSLYLVFSVLLGSPLPVGRYWAF